MILDHDCGMSYHTKSYVFELFSALGPFIHWTAFMRMGLDRSHRTYHSHQFTYYFFSFTFFLHSVR